jgi:4'-phosphopantetheinyl transferase
VSVISINLDAPHRGPAVLDDGERQRASRLPRTLDSDRFIAAHVATRIILAGVLGLEPEGVRFTASRHGKPRVSNGPADLDFNLAHSGSKALLAIAQGCEVGVDIEAHRPTDILGTAALICSPREFERIQRASLRKRPERFFRCWTRKESFVKACGAGRSFPLRRLEVSLKRDGEQLLLGCLGKSGLARRWTITNLSLGPGWSAALTMSSCAPVVSYWEFNDRGADRQAVTSDAIVAVDPNPSTLRARSE